MASKLAIMMIKQAGKERDGHRGAPLSSALYKLHEQRLQKQQELLKKVTQDQMNATKTTFKVEGTDELRINNFNREFVVRLTTILNDTY